MDAKVPRKVYVADGATFFISQRRLCKQLRAQYLFQHSGKRTYQTPRLKAPRCILRRGAASARGALPEVELYRDGLHRARRQARREREVERAAVLLDRDVCAHRERDCDLVHGGSGRRRVAVFHQLEPAVWGDEGERFVAGPSLQALEALSGSLAFINVLDGQTGHMDGTSIPSGTGSWIVSVTGQASLNTVSPRTVSG